MTRILLAVAGLLLLAACASAPSPRDPAAKDRKQDTGSGAVFSHIEIGGGY